MSKQGHRDNEVGPWAEEKLTLLQNYLQAYNTALKNMPFRRVYIDGFAGSPISRIRDTTTAADAPSAFLDDADAALDQARFVQGSPLRALGCDPGFHSLRFFDLDESRAENLRALTATHGERVQVTVGDCNPGIAALAGQFKASNLRGVAFLDPYGAHLEWSTVRALAATGKIEVIINLPIAMAINRLITRNGDIPENWAAQLDACFGTSQWRDLSYSESQPDLFGNTTVSKDDGVAEKLLELYLDRLKDEFAFVTAPRVIRNTKGMPLYYLLWAGPNRVGHNIANHVFRPYDKVAGQRGQTHKKRIS